MVDFKQVAKVYLDVFFCNNSQKIKIIPLI